jgi:hypothetical protein
MLQQNKPQDFVIATGETHTVREFVEVAFKEVSVDIMLLCFVSLPLILYRNLEKFFLLFF